MPFWGVPQPEHQHEASALRVKLWPVAAAPAISGPGWELQPSGAFQQVRPVSPPMHGHTATPGTQPSPWLSSQR